VVEFAICGDLHSIRIPAPQRSEFTHALWKHTCCEVFIAACATAYHECNLAPSSQWAFYHFERYRAGMPLDAAALAPSIRTRVSARVFALQACLNLGALLPSYAACELHLGLSAVIESESGSLSYWALRHVTPQPDFHHPQTRTLLIASNGVGAKTCA